MKYDDLIQELNTWEYDEKIYREYYFMKKTPEKVKDFVKSHSDHELEVGWVLNPELLNQHAGEDEFISEKYNVSLVKHPRYLPVFYHEHDFFEIIYVLSGTCTNSFRDSTEKLTAGDLCLLAPNVRHGILAVEDDSIILNILIRPPPLPRETAQQGHRGAQRNPAAGAQAFAPSGRRHLRSGGGPQCIRIAVKRVLLFISGLCASNR